MVLVLGTGLEELLPKFLGVGFPLLLTAVLLMSVREWTVAALTLFAIAAGTMEDAISSLPTMTSASFFLIVALISRWPGTPRMSAAFAFPCYQIWLSVWTGGFGGGLCTRILLSLPIGVLTILTVGTALTWLSGKAAIDEQG